MSKNTLLPGTALAQVVAAVEFAPLAPLREIARRLQMKLHTVHYLVNRAIELGYLGQWRPSIDLYPLGYSEYAIFFSLVSKRSSAKQGLLRDLLESSRVSWLAEVGGPFQYVFSMPALKPGEVSEYLQELAVAHGDIFEGKEIATRIELQSYGRKYLDLGRAADTLSVGFGSNSQLCTIDELDRRLLSGFANLSFSSFRDLALQLGVPLTTLQRRVAALEAAKVINGYYYSIDPARLGMQVVNLLVACRSVHPKIAEDLVKFCAAHPQIVHFVRCLGSWDFEVVVEGENLLAASAVRATLLDRFGGAITSIETVPVFRYLKSSLFPFGKTRPKIN
jgi:DNA-binding Lrp family transcriptional regulator